VEHYEMAGYGTARTYGELLGDKEGAKLLFQTFEEEKETDEKLTKLPTADGDKAYQRATERNQNDERND
jgi:ferritin-like metal-binding protein YciE